MCSILNIQQHIIISWCWWIDIRSCYVRLWMIMYHEYGSWVYDMTTHHRDVVATSSCCWGIMCISDTQYIIIYFNIMLLKGLYHNLLYYKISHKLSRVWELSIWYDNTSSWCCWSIMMLLMYHVYLRFSTYDNLQLYYRSYCLLFVYKIC